MGKDNQCDRIVGYIRLVAQMETTSPLRIGSGKENRADVEVMRLPDGSPYIPATSLVGAAYHRFHREVEQGGMEQAAEIFWGTVMRGEAARNPMTWQSHLRVSDMVLEAPEGERVRVRDGVRIDPKTGTAEEGKKFDYEFLEP